MRRKWRYSAMRGLCMVRLIGAAALLLLAPPPSFAAEVIQRFDAVVKVASDGSLAVTETIRVRAEGREIRRGIFRDFPTTFTDAGGQLRQVPFTLIDVTRNGRPEKNFLRYPSNTVRIYAGEEKVNIPSGDHTYVFRYRTSRQIRWFDGKPELNWNVTGNFWRFPILAASYRLELPDNARPAQWTAFTGPLGARGTDWRGAIGNDGVLSVASTRPLAAGEGLTVVVAIPQGAVSPPDRTDEWWWTFLDYRRWFVGSFGFLAVFAYYFFAWRAVGRDPKSGTVIPLFHPPKDISPALANYIHNWGLTAEKWRAFTAAALSLAVRGLILFESGDKSLTLKATGRKPASGEPLPPGERAIFNWIQGRGGVAEIDKANGQSVADIGRTFTTRIEQESRNKFFRRNIGYTLAGVAMTVVVIFGLFAVGGLRNEDIGTIAVIGFASIFLGMFLVPLLMTLFSGRFALMARAAIGLAVFGVFASIGFNIVFSNLPAGATEIGRMALDFGLENPFPFLLVGAFALLNGVFIRLMKAPTALGRPVMDQLEGLKLYLETAEKDRLNLQAPDITAERFERLLPYAVALEVEKPWAEAFEAALSRAHPGEAEPMRHYRPAWGTPGWTGHDFSRSVSSSVAAASSALSSAVPASSGSSGFSSSGGGSGGGGGGGGGGGW